METAIKERDSAVKELTVMKTDYQRKMGAVKLLEMELEAKVAALEHEPDAYVPSSSDEEEAEAQMDEEIEENIMSGEENSP